jgi:hypothetical protein
MTVQYLKVQCKQNYSLLYMCNILHFHVYEPCSTKEWGECNLVGEIKFFFFFNLFSNFVKL